MLSAQTENPELVQIIRNAIRSGGPVSLAWFIEQALYHPAHGYYASGRCAIGRRGDYFTNVSVGPMFGKLLAAQFFEIWKQLGKIDKFIIVEQGAHHGDFAHDVLKALRENWPEFFEALRYCVIEPFPVLQDRQSKTLNDFARRIDWHASLDDLDPFLGVHFSNELLDAVPVHLIVSTGNGWREKFVAVDGDKFVFVAQPIVDLALESQVSRLPAQPVGYQTEVNLAALDWIDNLSTKLTRGYVLTVDYGFPRDEFHASDRARGTLQVHAQHRKLASPFDEIRNADITAHVNWTSVAERAEAGELRLTGFTDQHHFLTGIVSEFPDLAQDLDAKSKRALQTLVHPEMLGRTFQVLGLAQAVDPGAKLSGFKFGRDPRAALGL